ncbi:MAG: chloride channel protein [Sphingomonadales bacterium]|nr:chloride channel protein [Sphingomonadales bacterium]
MPPDPVAPGDRRFWAAVILTGIISGAAAAALSALLLAVQHLLWPPARASLLAAASAAPASHHLAILLGAGLLTGCGQLLLVRLTTGNGIEITSALWFHAGRMPALRTLGSAVLSVITVGMGSSMGREGAPKQVGAVAANWLVDRLGLSDEQRRLLVACGAGAGMAAVYNVPLGGALFALEVLRGVLALRLVLPALTASMLATIIAWVVIPDAPTYQIPAVHDSPSLLGWALLAGPLIGVASAGFVRAVEEADRLRPSGRWRLVMPTAVFALLGAVSIAFPQLLGNGKDLSQLVFLDGVAPRAMLALMLLKPLATLACLGGGGSGGLFTPSLTFGALLGGVLGLAWSWLVPGEPLGIFAVIGAGALVAATTQGPISAAVLMIELTGHDRAFILPMLIAIAGATMVARRIDPRSIYDARLSDEELVERQERRLPTER